MPLTGEYEPSAAGWARDQVAWPDYAEYQKSTTRTVPVFVLTPVDA